MFETYRKNRETRELLRSSLAQIAMAKASESEKPVLVTTSLGLLEATPASADAIVADLQGVWGKKYPGLFPESQGLPDGLLRIMDKIA